MRILYLINILIIFLSIGCSKDLWSTFENNIIKGSTDTDPPYITSIRVGGQNVTHGVSLLNVAPNSDIVVTFNEDIEPSTITDSSIDIDLISNRYDEIVCNQVTISSDSYGRGTEHNVIIYDSIEDLSGNTLDISNPISFTFKIIANPTIIEVSPPYDSQLRVGDVINIKFNEMMDQNSGNWNMITSPTFPFSFTSDSWDPGGKILTLVPDLNSIPAGTDLSLFIQNFTALEDGATMDPDPFPIHYITK